MISFSDHIIFDKIPSWPREVIELIRNNKSSLTGFLSEEHRIDKLARTNFSIRYNRPENIYRENWDSTIDEIETKLKQHPIVGIHCTKLFDYEIRNIEQEGLKPLTREFANQRIESALKQGLISQDLMTELVDKKELDAKYRKGKIFVFHCLSTLKFEGGLNRLLGLWGGESLYAYSKNTQELKQIGIPCIVFTSIKIKELNIYPALSKRMVAFYFNDNYFPHDTDSIIEKELDVLRIIKRDEKLFEDLTGIQDWDEERY